MRRRECPTRHPGGSRGDGSGIPDSAPQPHRSEAEDEAALPDAYRTILAIARDADGPVQVRAVGERLSLDTSARGKTEPLRAKMTKPVEQASRDTAGNATCS
ncbi:hypothetical protein [Streptomyces regalis]|uniref:hypothetical protein n=1 Tax=Streptomyces regalis TaxID=68262 RepID=UPI001FC9F27E|nr:hypothetical protein [Streptomyces regalis]